jgi:hypothetical protein
MKLPRLHPREGRAAAKKSAESSGKDSTWEDIPFEVHNANDLLRGIPRNSAVSVILAAAAATAETDLFRQARGKNV